MAGRKASSKRAFGAYDKMPGDQNDPAHYNFRAEGVLASAKKSDDDRKRERRGKASSKLASAHYALRSADRTISNVLNYVTTAKKHLKGEEHIVQEIHELLIHLRAASLQAQLVLDNSQAKVAILTGGATA